MKQFLTRLARVSGTLKIMDGANYFAHRVISTPSNLAFRKRHPCFKLPPARLAFENYGHTNWSEYRSQGMQQAEEVAKRLNSALGDRTARVLEWGCGAGRLLRHIGGNSGWHVHGVDVDPAAVNWCRSHLQNVAVSDTDFLPPMNFADGYFDAVYHYSVWTHLSQSTIERWVAEFARILRPGGIMLGTTHGANYVRLLTNAEKQQYAGGQIVSRTKVVEGRKYYLSFHPPDQMSKLLSEVFTRVEHYPAEEGSLIPQDIWVGIR